jgi:hypothetical protein
MCLLLAIFFIFIQAITLTPHPFLRPTAFPYYLANSATVAPPLIITIGLIFSPGDPSGLR